MTAFTHRSCNYQMDLGRLLDFLLDYRAASDVRLYPTIWRIRLLLTSRVWEPSEDAQLWENEHGLIVGLAMLWRRRPDAAYLVLDVFLSPAITTEDLLLDVIQWGNQRAVEIMRAQQTSLTLYLRGVSRFGFVEPVLQNFDFLPVPVDPNEHNVYFSRSLQEPISSSYIPPDYTIRALRGKEDLESYRAISGFAEVNHHHQIELLESDEYWHIVVVNSEGEFCAYCECSFSRAEWMRTNQQIGWIDYVETKREYQGKGLGQAVLLAGLAKLKQMEAETAMLITVNTNLAAMNLYQKTGFAKLELVEFSRYQKDLLFDEMGSQ